MSETKHLLGGVVDQEEFDQGHQLIELGPRSPSLLTESISNRNIRHRSQTQQSQLMASTTADMSEHASSSSSSSFSMVNPVGDNPTTTTKYGTYISPSTSRSSNKRSTIFVDSRYPRTYFTKRQMFIACISMILFASALAITLIFGLPRLEAKRQEYFAGKFQSSLLPEVVNSKFTVLVSGNEYASCADSGRDILQQKNGSAMDAALASLFCVLVASPDLVGVDSGIHGLVNYKNRTFAIQAKEQIYWPSNINHSGISYPVLPIAAQQLHKKFGQISWASILTAPIWMSENGVPLSENLSKQISMHKHLLDNELRPIREWFRRTINQTERLIKDGEMFKNIGLSEMLKSIAINGSSQIFNDDWLLSQLNSLWNNTIDVQQFKSTFNQQESNIISIDQPIEFNLLNGSVRLRSASRHEPQQAIIIGHMLKILERLTIDQESGFDYCITSGDIGGSHSLKENTFQFQYILETLWYGSNAYHRLSNVSNWSYSVDNEKDIENIVQQIINITENGQNSFKTLENNLPQQQGHNVQIIVYDDRTGDMVALTTSKLRTLFQEGTSKLVANKQAFVLDIFKDRNDRQTYSKGSSLFQWPVMVLDSKADNNIDLVLGAVGGQNSLQTLSSIVQVMHKLLFNCQTLKSAIDESRFNIHNNGKYFTYEQTFPQIYIDLLMRMFSRTNQLKSTNRIKGWMPCGVYGMLKRRTNSTQLRSMIDSRFGGYVVGL